MTEVTDGNTERKERTLTKEVRKTGEDGIRKRNKGWSYKESEAGRR